MQPLSRRLAMLLLLVVAASCRRVEEVQPVAAPITVLADDGSTVSLTPSDDTVIAQIATWCPYSTQYVNFLRDPQTRTLLSGKKFVFLLEQSEWPTVRQKLAEEMAGSSEADIDKALETLKERAGYAPVFEPEALQNMPGKYYFIPPGSSIQGGSFPEAYNAFAGKCTEHPIRVIKNFVANEELLATLWRRHAPRDDS